MPKTEAAKPRAAAARTVKVSRQTKRWIDAASDDGESVDATLKRLLGLTRRGGNGHPRPPAPAPSADAGTATTIKVSERLMEHIVGKAAWKESIDHTLRRLLGIPADEK